MCFKSFLLFILLFVVGSSFFGSSCTKTKIVDVIVPDTLVVHDTLRTDTNTIIKTVKITIHDTTIVYDTIRIYKKKTPGKFTINVYDPTIPLSKKLTKKKANNTSYIDLDSIHSSQKFLFEIKNSGQEPISNISLSLTSNDSSLSSHWSVSPKSINILSSNFDTSNSDSFSQSIIPILQVSINHGINLNGTGWNGLLKSGDNFATFNISGITRFFRDSTDTIGFYDTIKLSQSLKVFAYVTDFKILAFDTNNNVIDTVNDNNISQKITKNLMTSNLWNLSHYKISIINTGNSNFTIQLNKLHWDTSRWLPINTDPINFKPSDTLIYLPQTTNDSIVLNNNSGSINTIFYFNSVSNIIYNLTKNISDQTNGYINFGFYQSYQ